nr:MAG TPA: hypothetical protein [Caudoviricetes sp.]
MQKKALNFFLHLIYYGTVRMGGKRSCPCDAGIRAEGSLRARRALTCS